MTNFGTVSREEEEASMENVLNVKTVVKFRYERVGEETF